jgi:plasmid stability protein
MNKEFTRMLKLAGLMTEGLYTSDAKASMEAMSHGKMTKKELKAKIKEMMLPEETPGEMAYAAVDSMDEVDSDHTMAAYRIAREMVRRMDFPDAMFGSKDLFLATIKALQDELYSYAEDQFGNAGSAPDEYDDYDDSMDVYDDEYPDMAETMFEAKKDEEADTEDVIVADTEEVPAEDAAVDVTAGDTQVDVNMDGVPDVDTGSAESKKAFTSLVDTYNASKELGDPKLTQMIANALTYYNKNIILKAGQPQA